MFGTFSAPFWPKTAENRRFFRKFHPPSQLTPRRLLVKIQKVYQSTPWIKGSPAVPSYAMQLLGKVNFGPHKNFSDFQILAISRFDLPPKPPPRHHASSPVDQNFFWLIWTYFLSFGTRGTLRGLFSLLCEISAKPYWCVPLHTLFKEGVQ